MAIACALLAVSNLQDCSAQVLGLCPGSSTCMAGKQGERNRHMDSGQLEQRRCLSPAEVPILQVEREDQPALATGML